MKELQIYNSRGEEWGSEGAGEERSEKIRSIFKNGIKFSMEPRGGGYEAYLYFQAKQNDRGRYEQFYARYLIDDASQITELPGEIRRRVEERDHILNESSGVYRAIERGRNDRTVGSETERSALDRVMKKNQHTVVGVDSAEDAYSLFTTKFGEAGDVAIADAEPNNTERSLTIVTGHAGITPVGEQTERTWKRELETQELNSIRDSVQTLSTACGLSDTEIRNRVQRKAPALRDTTAESSGTGGRSDVLFDDVKKLVPALLVVVGVVLLLWTGLSFFGVGIGETAVSVTVDGSGGEGDQDLVKEVELRDSGGEIVDEGRTDQGGHVRLSGDEIENDGMEYELRINATDQSEWRSDEMTLEALEEEYQGGSPGTVARVIDTITLTTVYNLEVDINEPGMEVDQETGTEDETDGEGESDPQPEFEIDEFDVPDNPETNAQSEVFVNVANTGNGSGVVFVDLDADGINVGSDEREIKPDAEESVTFEWTPNEAGEVDLTVGLDADGVDGPIDTRTRTVDVTEGQE